MKSQRNQPCPCGSKRKSKKCCLSGSRLTANYNHNQQVIQHLREAELKRATRNRRQAVNETKHGRRWKPEDENPALRATGDIVKLVEDCVLDVADAKSIGVLENFMVTKPKAS